MSLEHSSDKGPVDLSPRGVALDRVIRIVAEKTGTDVEDWEPVPSGTIEEKWNGDEDDGEYELLARTSCGNEHKREEVFGKWDTSAREYYDFFSVPDELSNRTLALKKPKQKTVKKAAVLCILGGIALSFFCVISGTAVRDPGPQKQRQKEYLPQKFHNDRPHHNLFIEETLEYKRLQHRQEVDAHMAVPEEGLLEVRKKPDMHSYTRGRKGSLKGK